MSTTSPHLIRISQVARLLDVHPKTVRRWIATGRLPATRLPGGERRIPHDALAPLLARPPVSTDPP